MGFEPSNLRCQNRPLYQLQRLNHCPEHFRSVKKTVIVVWAILVWTIVVWAIVVWAITVWAIVVWAIVVWAIVVWAIVDWTIVGHLSIKRGCIFTRSACQPTSQPILSLFTQYFLLHLSLSLSL